MQTLRNTCLVAALLASGSVSAQGLQHMHYNIGVVSDYVFRGISQTDNHPALQGGADFRHPGGLYAGIWGTTQDIPNTRSHLRGDAYGGFSYQGTYGLGFDIGGRLYSNAYIYPGQARDSFWELYAGLMYRTAELKMYREFDEDETYAEANVRFDLGSGVWLNLHAGRYFLKGPRGVGDDYSDYRIGLGRMFNQLEAEIAVTTTDQEPDTDVNDTLFVISLKYLF